MIYNKVRFISGYDGFGYQAIDERGTQVAIVDDKGAEIAFVAPYECEIAEEDVAVPFSQVALLPREDERVSLGERIDRIELTPEQEKKINDIIQAVLNTPPDQLPKEILA